ncbi:MAG: Disulfide bond formation protein B [Gammaproteobacteria bacterium]|nr:Disulfide bond formation protein B [Gammaproteobacteria bacterium]
MLNPRPVCILGLLVCVGLLAYAFYMEHVLLIEPCPLCWLQRFVFAGFAVVFLICAIQNPGGWGRYVYVLVFGVLTALGAGLASRHLWLQSLPPEAQPECGVGVGYMMDIKPLVDVIAWAARGTGECAQIQWTYLGISIPGWTLMAFVLLGATVIVSLIRNPRLRRRDIFR